ncbi:hypothetical protein MIR68_008646 [Amoeboaphelidium protococcarum]|nr:hypothetical protein MIR68_008646 [Amoeboaphelidium protococcarum]
MENIAEDSGHILKKEDIQSLIKQVDQNQNIEPDVQDVLLSIADDFLMNTITASISLAKHRNSDTLEAKDLALALQSQYGIKLPGFGGLTAAQSLQSSIQPSTSGGGGSADQKKINAHQQRLNQVRKAIKDNKR